MSDDTSPWARPGAAVVAALDTDLATGLTAAEAARRLGRDGPNELVHRRPESPLRRLVRQFADPLTYLLIAATAVSLVAWVVGGADGIPYEAVVIGVIVVANGLLGYAQETRAENAVAALQQMTAATATVVRDGEETVVPSAELVRGDLIVVGEGDAVSADARVVSSTDLTVAEAALTGESEPVAKRTEPVAAATAVADRTSMVHRGTAVTRGRGRGVVTAVGMDSEVGRVADLLGETRTERTPLQIEIARIGRALGIAVIIIAVVVVAAMFFVTDIRTLDQVVEVLLVGVSLAVAAVPEGLPTILTVVLALGVRRMAASSAVVKRLSSVETLGSASVVCSDKTGTLTRNEMTMTEVTTASGTVTITGSGYQPDGDLRDQDAPVDDPSLREEALLVIGGGSLASNAVFGTAMDTSTLVGDPTEAAFIVAEQKAGIATARRDSYERLAEVPFNSERKLMSVVARRRDDGDAPEAADGAAEPGQAAQAGQAAPPGDPGDLVITKGAPDVLLSRCVAERVGAQVRTLSDDRRAQILAAVDGKADRALRTLGVAYREMPAGADVDESLEHDLVHLGVVGIMDPPREEAAAAIAEAHRAGIRVLMITGDHPRTARRIAADLGIIEPDGPVIAGADLAALTPAELAEAVRRVPVYARVAPEQKLAIVGALREAGEIVAMTGDGVNDAPALKAADIGVAMGITGTAVSKEAADMILVNDDFATIIRAVREGRSIFDGLRRTVRFLLSSNIGEVLTMLMGVVLASWLGLTGDITGVAAPLLATQILWVNLLTDTAPALAMALDPVPEDVMERPPRRPDDRVIDLSMWIGIAWVGAVMAVVSLIALDLGMDGGLFGGSGDITSGRTMAFTTLVLAQLFNCFNARSDHTSAFHHLFTNAWLWGAIAVSALLQVAVVHVPFLNSAFATTPLSIGQWATCVGLASIVLFADELKKLAARALR